MVFSGTDAPLPPHVLYFGRNNFIYYNMMILIIIDIFCKYFFTYLN